MYGYLLGQIGIPANWKLFKRNIIKIKLTKNYLNGSKSCKQRRSETLVNYITYPSKLYYPIIARNVQISLHDHTTSSRRVQAKVQEH